MIQLLIVFYMPKMYIFLYTEKLIIEILINRNVYFFMFLVLIVMQDEKTNEIRCPWCILVVRRLLAVPDIQVYTLQNHISELGSFLLNSFATTNHTINLLALREIPLALAGSALMVYLYYTSRTLF